MPKMITCIECPKGCSLSVDIENCKVTSVAGNLCPKGTTYATAEVENPLRVLTSTVRAVELSLKMVPVRTDKPIPKSRLLDAMHEVRKTKIEKPVHLGDIIIADFLGLAGVNLIATRNCPGIKPSLLINETA